MTRTTIYYRDGLEMHLDAQGRTYLEGIAVRATRKYFPTKSCPAVGRRHSDTFHIALPQLTGVFLSAAMAFLAAFGLFLVEVLIDRRTRRNSAINTVVSLKGGVIQTTQVVTGYQLSPLRYDWLA